MSRFFLELTYNGAKYHGWQVQPNALSVQQTIETALSSILKHSCGIVGAGRTDTGVHALLYVAHFDTDNTEKVLSEDFIYHLNCMLPYDIAIRDVRLVTDEAHARFSAIDREYKYIISRRKNPFTINSAYQFFHPLDVDKMNVAAAMLLTCNDFTSFAKLHSDSKTNYCDVSYAQWDVTDDDTLVFTIRANRFLRNMVRAVVGSLINVGRGVCSIEDFINIIEIKDRCQAGSSAPANGLYLTDVTYPSNIYVL